MAAGPPWGFSVCLVLVLLASVSAKSNRRPQDPDNPFLRRADYQNSPKKRLLSGQEPLKPRWNPLSTGNHGSMENQGPRGSRTNFLKHDNLEEKYSSVPRDFLMVQEKSLLESLSDNIDNLDRSQLNATTVQRLRHHLERRFGPPLLREEMRSGNELTRPRAQTARDSGQPPSQFRNQEVFNQWRLHDTMPSSQHSLTQEPEYPTTSISKVSRSRGTDYINSFPFQKSTLLNESSREEESGWRFFSSPNFPQAKPATFDAQCCALLSGIFCADGENSKKCQRCTNCTIEDFVSQTCPSLLTMTAPNTSYSQEEIGYAHVTSGDSCYRYYQNSARQTAFLRRNLDSNHGCSIQFDLMCPSFNHSVRQVEEEMRRRVIQQIARRTFIIYKWRRMLRKQRLYNQQSIQTSSRGQTRRRPPAPMEVVNPISRR